MTDNPPEMMLPYQRTLEYRTRVIEVAALMIEHQDGVTLQQVAEKLQTVMQFKVRKLFELNRSPHLVGSKFLYLSTWRDCLIRYNPDRLPSFPLAQELDSQSTDESLRLWGPSTEYKAYYDREIFEQRQRDDRAGFKERESCDRTNFHERQIHDRNLFEQRQRDDCAGFEEREGGDRDLFEQRQINDRDVFVQRQINDRLLFEQHQSDVRDLFEQRQQAIMTVPLKVIEKKVINDLPPPAATQLLSSNTPQPKANQPGPSTTLAPPVVTKPQANAVSKPSAEKTGVSKATLSPVVAHTPGNDKPQPVASNSGKGPGGPKALQAVVRTSIETPDSEPAPKRRRVSALATSR